MVCHVQGDAALEVDYQRNLQPPMLRGLQEAPGPAGEAEVTYVMTPEELHAAVSQGARHIEITEHLDLTTLKADTTLPSATLFYLDLSSSIRSIRVCHWH
jgi:hypothetical protein